MANKPVGWEKAWEICPLSNMWKGAKAPGVLLVVSFVLYLFKGDVGEIEQIKLIGGIITNGFPSIIGFILTGYALIIGFSGSDFLLKMAKSKADEKHSLFERVNSTFALVIGILVVTYLVASVFEFVMGLQIEWPFREGIEVYNASVLFLLLFLFYYSVCALLDIVLNIFNLGQLAHAVAQNRLRTIELNAQQEESDSKDLKGNKSLFLKMLHNLLALMGKLITWNRDTTS